MSSFLMGIVRTAAICGALCVMSSSAGLAQAQPMAAHPQPIPTMTRDEVVAFAKIHVAVGQLRDSAQVKLRLPENAGEDPQKQLRDALHAKILETLKQRGMTDEDFRRKTYIVSANDNVRATFDTVVSQLTGVPLPSKLLPVSASVPVVKVPAGAVGMHIGHVVNSFRDTPAEQGLLPTALAEARIAIVHAGLAARAPTNLDAMKTHAGHVINAVDPTVMAVGPGLGYGVKKAAMGMATHIELAAKAEGASANVIAHSTHVAMSARNTVLRSDQVVALAQRIQAATSAADAAPLVTQLVTLTQQLVAGADANGDGKVTWEQGEGGLQQAQDHLILMLAGEHLPPG